jgi:hypothetical protein
MKSGLCIAVTALAVGVLAGGWLFGDDKKPDDPTKSKGTLPQHYKKLGLTDKQQQDIYKIQAGYHDKIEDLQRQLDDLKKQEKADIEKVLTDDQKARLKELLIGDLDKDKTAPADKDKAPPADKDKAAPAEKDKPKDKS